MRRRYGGYNGRKRLGGSKVAILTVLFWAVSGFIMLSFFHGGPTKMIEAKGEDVAKMYIGNIFPTVSRGAEYESREALSTSVDPAAEPQKGLLGAKKSASILEAMVGNMFPAAVVLDEDDLGEGVPGYIPEAPDVTDPSNPDESSKEIIDTQKEEPSGSDPANVDYSKPVVLIYHTHATESYQPVSEGNFHSLNAYGTVREVGDALTKELEAKGIQVIHDKTINDSPSYNQSYTRSLETIKRIMADNDKNMIVIDLHRDAAAYTGNEAKTVSVKKDTIAKYNLVVGTGNPNVEQLKQFANQVNRAAEDLYPGFGGRIIEKQYKFNQYVSDHHLLLEVGNNENTIEQAKLTGKYFGDVIAKVIKDME